ncbi:MAG: flagellin lysine-N-methylase, partial [Chloroflexota bacterium]|nr:flagellin lysine-N-methylase [Chloroflexota bacterium]
MIVRAPAYLARFRCVGAACEDHCCGGWQGVDVDAPTYERYLGVDEPTLGPLLRLHVIRNEDPAATATEHALIDVTGDGGCPFLTGERLCAIQGTLGEALLPSTCDTFPRLATLIDGTIDVGGRLACPEIARLVLLDPDALAIGEAEPDRRLRERGRFWIEAPWLDEPEEGDPRRHYHRVRARCLDLLGRGDVALGARLRALGLALGELSDATHLHAESVDWAFAEAARHADRQWTRAADSGPEPSELLLARIRVWVAMQGVPARYRRCLDRLRDGLGLPTDPNASLSSRTRAAYAAALDGHVRPYLRARPHLLENLLANVIHVSTSPYHPRRSFASEYAVLVCRLAILIIHLAGAAAAERRLTDELVVETVQAFDKYADS